MRSTILLVVGVSSCVAVAFGAGRVVAAGPSTQPAPSSPQAPALDQASPPDFADARVERMLDNRIACRGCHVIAGRGGRIGPSLDGVGARADETHVRRMITEPSTVLPATLMPLQRVPERDLDRLVDYLMRLPERAPEGPAVTIVALPPTDAASGEGAVLYARHCAACHGAGGDGNGWNAPTLPVPPTAHSDAERMSERLDDALYDGIAAGAWVLDGSPLMPGYGDTLTPEQIRALVAHIRVLCACAQPDWASG